MTQRKKKHEQVIKAWGGFSDSNLHCTSERKYDERRWAVFLTKQEARQAYEDVRPVKIIVEDK